MSSFARTIQKRLLAKKNIAQVPLYKPSKRGRKMVGMRHRLCAAHSGYMIDGTALIGATEKPKRGRKPRASQPAA